jgi:hypothetical protein
MELGVPYSLVGPDGTRVVFGNSDAARADADYIGPLDPEAGIAGLDSPDMRESGQDRVQADGGINFDGFHSRRPVVINGEIDRNAAIATVLAREQKLKRATNAMRANAVLSWTNTGYPARSLRLRRQAPIRISGRRPKTFQLPMIDADYRLLSVAEANVAATARNVAAAVTNAGDELATPRIEVTGPVLSQVVLRNVTAGLAIFFKAGFNVASGKLLVVDLAPPYPTVTYDGADAYGQIDFLATTWWGMVPGAQNLRVDGGSGAGTWRAYWKDAWL